MLSAIRKRLHLTPSTLIATLALVFAMSGGAYAASKYVITSTKQIKPSVLKSLQGKAGKAGANGATGAAGATGPVGATGPAGAAGAKGENGAAGGNGTNGGEGKPGKEGKEGPEGKSGFTKTLPSGETETGRFDVSVYGDVEEEYPGAIGSISFPIPLSSAGQSFVFTREQTENEEFGTSGCEGIVEGVPTAPKGTLCLYASHGEIQNAVGTLTASEGPGLTNGFGKSGALLGGILLEGSVSAPAKAAYYGSWAVTAP
jgi:hypothetical protein